MTTELVSDRSIEATLIDVDEELLTPSSGKLRVVIFDTFSSSHLPFLTFDVDDLAEAEKELGEYDTNTLMSENSNQTPVKAYVFDYEGKRLVERGGF